MSGEVSTFVKHRKPQVKNILLTSRVSLEDFLSECLPTLDPTHSPRKPIPDAWFCRMKSREKMKKMADFILP
jgi:hypothetical protein